MMIKKRFISLVAIAGVAVAVATVLSLRQIPEREGSLAGEPLLPGLSGQINDIRRIGFTGAGNEPVLTLERDDAGWRAVERDGWSADVARVRGFLLELADSRLLEAKTANPDRYATLGVEDVESADAGGVRVDLEGEGGYASSLIIGNQAGMSGMFVRRPDEAGSWQVSGDFVVHRDISQWLQRGITDIGSSRIRDIELTIGDGPALRVFKDSAGDANFQVADVPAGRRLSSDFVANGMGSMLSTLNLDEVARDDGQEPTADGDIHRATYRLFDGLAIELEAWRDADGGAPWMRLSASLDETAAETYIRERVEQEQAQAVAQAQNEAGAELGSEDVSVGNEPDDVLPAIDIDARLADGLAELRQEVAQINARTDGWRFRLPEHKFDPINKRMDDLLAAAD